VYITLPLLPNSLVMS